MIIICCDQTSSGSSSQGLGEGIVDVIDNENKLDNWLDLTDSKQEVRQHIQGILEQELNGKLTSGMRPKRADDGSINFMHLYVFGQTEKV